MPLIYKPAPGPGIFTTVPPKVAEKKPGQLTETQLNDFFDKGYVHIPDFFKNDMEKLDACRRGLGGMVDVVADTLSKAGKIKNKYEDVDFSQRLIKIDNEFPGAAVYMHKLGMHPKECLDLYADEKLLNVVEQIIGTDIAAHPVWNIRPKIPHEEQHTVPWHQDSAYLEDCTYTTMQVTAWIPLLDTDQTNGCLQMAEGGHRSGKIAAHECCAGNTWYIMLDEEEMEKSLGVDVKRDVKTIPVPYGGALFFNNLIPHRSLDNNSDGIRWSLDLRWQRPDLGYGLYGLKQGTLLRSSTDPNFVPDWSDFKGVDRSKAQNEAMNMSDEEQFDTRIAGPWMNKWPMTHENRHTSALRS